MIWAELTFQPSKQDSNPKKDNNMTPEQKSFIGQVEIRTMRNDLHKINKGGFIKEKPVVNIEITGQNHDSIDAVKPLTQIKDFDNLNPLQTNNEPALKQWPEIIIGIDKPEEKAKQFDSASNAYEQQRKRLEQQAQKQDKIILQKPVQEQKTIPQETEDPEKMFLKEIEEYKEKALAQNLAARQAAQTEQAKQEPATDGHKKAGDEQIRTVPQEKIITEQVKLDKKVLQSEIHQEKEPVKNEVHKLTAAVHRPSIQPLMPEKPSFKVKTVAKAKAKNSHAKEMAVPEIKFNRAKQPEKPLKEFEPKPEVVGIENLVKGKRFMEEVEEWINSQNNPSINM